VTEEERKMMEQIARAQSEPASHVARAKMLLAVADGKTYQAAAEAAGRKSNDAVSAAERERILAEARRTPERERDGTATWTLSTLQRALRQAPDGLPKVSTYTIWHVLREAGFGWQESRTWCETGKVKRKRKGGVVEVTDPDAEGDRPGC
jgi:transposase